MNVKIDAEYLDYDNMKTLTKEEEKELFRKYKKEGDKEAKEKLIEGNLRLILYIINRHNYNKSFENINDIFQVGCLGLIKAINNYDISRGVKFVSYAYPMIRGEIIRYLRNYQSIRTSRSILSLIKDIQEVIEKYREQYKKEPKLKEISEELDIDIKRIEEAMKAINKPESLQKSVFINNKEEVELEDLLEGSDIEEENIDLINIKEGISTLPYREGIIINLKYFHGKTQKEIKERLGISQAQVSRLENSALKRLKNNYFKRG